MIDVTGAQVKKMLEEAFDYGYRFGVEGKEAYMKGVLAGFPGSNKEEDFRIYTVTELREMPFGATFLHSTWGEASVVNKNGEKMMKFVDPAFGNISFSCDGRMPWNGQMLRLS